MAFAKGQSGNPGGRPKSIVKLLEIARKHSPYALRYLVKVVRNEAEDTRERLVAAKLLLERGMGKPVAGFTATHLTDEELVAELLARKEERAEQPGNTGGNLDA